MKTPVEIDFQGMSGTPEIHEVAFAEEMGEKGPQASTANAAREAQATSMSLSAAPPETS